MKTKKQKTKAVKTDEELTVRLYDSLMDHVTSFGKKEKDVGYAVYASFVTLGHLIIKNEGDQRFNDYIAQILTVTRHDHKCPDCVAEQEDGIPHPV